MTDLARFTASIVGRGNKDDVVLASDVADLMGGPTPLAVPFDPASDPDYDPAGGGVAATVYISDDTDAPGKGYDGMTVAELRQEIDRRNENRVDPIPHEGRKADLIAALVADDAPGVADPE